MPIVIGIVALVLVGVGAVFFFSSSEVETVSDTTSPTEELVAQDQEVEESTDETNSDDNDVVEIETETEVRPEDIEGSVVTQEESVEESGSSFNDGTYTTDASYFTPRRVEHEMLITLEVENDVIVDANITYDGGEPVTGHHTRFDAAYTSDVVGVRLDEVSLSRTGGASLTSAAFNEAVDQIKADATS